MNHRQNQTAFMLINKIQNHLLKKHETCKELDLSYADLIYYVTSSYPELEKPLHQSISIRNRVFRSVLISYKELQAVRRLAKSLKIS
ncbi:MULTISPECIES: hypothetical protein [Shouchella]|uniref:Uncharacterized protein n=2 Tax=Shouchella TaxID=2893057 RepID=A0ABY7WGL9_9BACI|nr:MULTISPECIES: hypothetical protein [Shouchella]MED4128770.1 hypothetical protein [Shouchella miscanthi]WDF05790.1 hypothetical protein PQ477_10250 [Shouchella hunanensis]GAF20446.1 hypothetical protein JCM19047_83 [Bacillus sp. JCM 19047]